VAVGGEALVLGAAVAIGGTPAWLFGVVAAHAFSVGLLRAPWLFALVVDVGILSVLLAFTGGASNPFSAVYFAQVVLAAVLLGRRFVAVWLVAVAAYGSLFFLPGDPHAHPHHGFESHLYGMFFAFVLTSGVLGFFVSRLSEALAEARQREVRAQRAASLITLAAGAAHELGTPLATIALVSKELARRLEDDADAHEDAMLIRHEVDRCRAVLDSLSHESGGTVGEAPSPLRFEVLAGEVRDRLPGELASRLHVRGAGELVVPARATRQALENLVRNAFDAAPEGDVELAFDDGVIEVRDRGEGMDSETRARATEPFFTTKDDGMGLGLLLVTATAEALGGGLELLARPGGGTIARLRLG